MVKEEVMFFDGSRGIRLSNTYKASSLEVAYSKEALNKFLEKVNDKEDALCFRTYSYTPWGIMKPHLFGEMHEEVNLMPQDACLSKAQTLLAILAPTLLLYKLESGKNISVAPVV